MVTYNMVELAKIETTKEELLAILKDVFDLLNPDDWGHIEATLINDGPNASENSYLDFRDTEKIIRLNNPHGVFEIFSGKLPKTIYFSENKLLPPKNQFSKTYQLIKQFFPWGYHLVALKAISGYDHYALTSTELDISLIGWHRPTISIRSNLKENDNPFGVEKILDYLTAHGYKVNRKG